MLFFLKKFRFFLEGLVKVEHPVLARVRSDFGAILPGGSIWYNYCAEGASFSATQGFKRLVCVCPSVTDFSDFCGEHNYAPASPPFPVPVISTWIFRNP